MVFWILIVNFLNTNFVFAETCPANTHFVKAHSRSGYYRYDGVYVRPTHVSSSCRANPQGYDLWKDKLVDRAPKGWPNKIEKFKRWTESEREQVIEALGRLPNELTNIKVKSIGRAAKSKDPNNPASNFDDSIVLYDSAFNSKGGVDRILAHELAHRYYKAQPDEFLSRYQVSSLWYTSNPKTKNEKVLSLRDDFVAPDGTESPEEDFANNVEYFLYDRKKLKTVSPSIESWLEINLGDKLRLKGVK